MRKFILRITAASLLALTYSVSTAQNSVGIGTTTPDTNAVLDLVSTDQGDIGPKVDRSTTSSYDAYFNGSTNGLIGVQYR